MFTIIQYEDTNGGIPMPLRGHPGQPLTYALTHKPDMPQMVFGSWAEAEAACAQAPRYFPGLFIIECDEDGGLLRRPTHWRPRSLGRAIDLLGLEIDLLHWREASLTEEVEGVAAALDLAGVPTVIDGQKVGVAERARFLAWHVAALGGIR